MPLPFPIPAGIPQPLMPPAGGDAPWPAAEPAKQSKVTAHYVDPPYHPSTRSTKSRKGGDKYHVYQHELSDADHHELLAFLRTLEGMVILSGYPLASYDRALADWRRVTMETHADGGRDRTEVLWINPQACAALDATRKQQDLFRIEQRV